METAELINILAQGEDSYHQFKVNLTNGNAIAAELVAFSNTNGGKLIVGVDDEGQVVGLEQEQIASLNQLLANAASQSVKPAINPISENIILPGGTVVVIHVAQGLNKPYMDNQGYIWIKSGADKRRVTAREDLQRMFQQSALIHADEVPVANTSVQDIDYRYFEQFFERQYGATIAEYADSLLQLLTNMNLINNNQLNIAATLLFATDPQFKLPAFVVKAVAFPGVDITDENYIDSRDVQGKLADVFQQTLSFILANIRHVQNEQNVNSIGEPEIPRIAIEELLANALIHRDYFVSAPIRVFVFADRIELISPGHLPNNLTIENIKLGNSNIRNPILASFAAKLLPYRGLGSGIRRALSAYPHIDLIEDKGANTFTVVIKRTS